MAPIGVIDMAKPIKYITFIENNDKSKKITFEWRFTSSLLLASNHPNVENNVQNTVLLVPNESTGKTTAWKAFLHALWFNFFKKNCINKVTDYLKNSKFTCNMQHKDLIKLSDCSLK
uniref:Uncharacterized protein n=1 Tax=Strongyloides venezuelensis TaxID=75913 RepID=A0A0K0G5R9_STRVS